MSLELRAWRKRTEWDSGIAGEAGSKTLMIDD